MSDIIKQAVPVERQDHFIEIELGQWYWISFKEGEEIMCVNGLGSNCVHFRDIEDDHNSHRSFSILLTEFEDSCRFEPNPEQIIQEKIQNYQGRVQRLMTEVKRVSASLSLEPRKGLQSGTEETQALSLRGNGQPIEEYKQDLIKAKEKTLPDLFKKIKDANEKMARWMQAPLLPMLAKAKELDGLIDEIKGRIFNVQLYAGLIEEVEKIQDGEPAGISEKIRIFQRRHYMDEECLANYRTGGMTFKEIPELDRWLLEPENLNRILPHQRCVVSFQVRRKEKERHFADLWSYIKFLFGQDMDYDKLTFLYIRNGEQVYRLITAIDFNAKLFPDQEHSVFNGKVYVYINGFDHERKIISEGEYLSRMEAHARRVENFRSTLEDLKKFNVPEEEWPYDYASANRGFGHRDKDENITHYVEWSPDNIQYDKITKFVQKQIDEHSRLVFVLQGLIDRSTVFHPHPPWQLWSGESFMQAIELIFDSDCVLTTGNAPDFEAFRKKLNASIKEGSVVTGQDDFWQELEAVKENERRYRLHYSEHQYEITRHRPYGNSGPGHVAKVVKVTKKGCKFEWFRERQQNAYYWKDGGPIKCTVTVPFERLLNVSAYTPGDFKIFYSDPRTRADYAQWAPLLLEAEEYHAGNRKI